MPPDLLSIYCVSDQRKWQNRRGCELPLTRRRQIPTSSPTPLLPRGYLSNCQIFIQAGESSQVAHLHSSYTSCNQIFPNLEANVICVDPTRSSQCSSNHIPRQRSAV